MKGFIGLFHRVCFMNGICDEQFLLWDTTTPWDGPTEWS